MQLELHRDTPHMDMDHQSNLFPQKVQSSACDSHAVQAQIIRGGQWIVILCSDGILHLHQPGSDMPSVVDDTFKATVDSIGTNDGVNMSLSVSDYNESLLLLTIFCSWDAL